MIGLPMGFFEKPKPRAPRKSFEPQPLHVPAPQSPPQTGVVESDGDEVKTGSHVIVIDIS